MWLPAAFGRLCVETPRPMWLATVYQPAAFGRLCVETVHMNMLRNQPLPAAFGRLCVETSVTILLPVLKSQPPSGGCVLKHSIEFKRGRGSGPAAFGRLCVETKNLYEYPLDCLEPAAFGRLCVETATSCKLPSSRSQPPSGGCVLKREEVDTGLAVSPSSRLRAAVC